MSHMCYPPTRPIRSTEPTLQQEPIDIPAAKLQCGVNGDHLDQWFKDAIPDARRQLERETSIVCYTGTFTWKITNFPASDYIEIQLRPVTSITSIVYTATDGTSTTWSSSEYSLDTGGVAPLVKLGYGYVWPSVRGDINGITITFAAGYATVVLIPPEIKSAVRLKLHAHHLTNKGEDGAPSELAYERLLPHIGRPAYA